MLKIPRPPSKGEESLALQLKVNGIPFFRQFRFHPERKWKSDFLITVPGILVEIEGGSWSGGGHNRGKRFSDDCEKYAEAVIRGYRVMRFTTDQATGGYALDCIKRAMKS